MTTPVLTHDLELVRQIVLEHLDGFCTRVYLFGSQATGRAYQSSDIDVAILPLEKLPDGIFFNIRNALDESDVLRNVDVVNLLDVGENFRERVIREGVVWQG